MDRVSVSRPVMPVGLVGFVRSGFVRSGGSGVGGGGVFVVVSNEYHDECQCGDRIRLPSIHKYVLSVRLLFSVSP